MSAQDQQNSDRIVRNIDYLQFLKNRWKEVFLVFLLVLVISVVVTLSLIHISPFFPGSLF